MKQLLFLCLFIIFSGLQVAHAGFIGTAEILMLLVVGFFALAVIVGFIFLSLYLIRRSKSAQNEK